MGNIRWIIGLVMLFFCFTAAAQNQGSDTNKNSSAAHSTRSQQKGTADTPGAKDAANQDNQTGQNSQDQNGMRLKEDNGNPDNTSNQAASNAPAVPQTTSSQSGSPAMLSSEDGKGRDGTNNVQRATMNMAGAPAENLHMGNVQPGDAGKALKDRQEYTRGKQVSAERSGSPVNGNGDSQEINNNNRRENNAQSDQNLSSKEKVADDSGQSRRAERRAKRKKDKG